MPIKVARMLKVLGCTYRKQERHIRGFISANTGIGAAFLRLYIYINQIKFVGW